MKYFNNICQKCGRDFSTNTRARSYCYLCNPFSISYKRNQSPVFTKLIGFLETITENGVVTGNDVSFLTDLVINKSPEADLEGSTYRPSAWYIGVKLIAPTGYTSNAVYKSRTPRLDPANPAHSWDSLNDKIFNDYKDGEDFITLWVNLNDEFVNNYVKAGINIVYDYIFDWDGDGVYEQTITVTIDPTKLTLKNEDGSVTIYPTQEPDTPPLEEENQEPTPDAPTLEEETETEEE